MLTVKNYSDESSLAGDIAMNWFQWNNLRQPQMALWAEIDQYIHATDNTNLASADWDHKTFIPAVAEIHEDLMAILYSTILPHDDWLGWRGYDMDAVTASKRKKLLAYIKQVHTTNGFREDLRQIIDDYIRYGNCFAEVEHCDETFTKEDGSIGGFIGPKIKRISPYDIVFNPIYTDFSKTPKIVRKLVPVGNFAEYAMKLKAQGVEIDEEIVKKVIARRGTSTTISDTSDKNKDAQFVPDGFGTLEQYYASGFVEMLCFRGDLFDPEEMEAHHSRS